MLTPTKRSGEADNAVNFMADSITVDKYFLNELFCTAYRRGHEDTVEGCYIDVLSNDWDTYFDEETTEILEESNDLHQSERGTKR